MFKGVYKGKEANNQKSRVLILGESHYSKDGSSDFSTQGVLENYHKNPTESKYRFFRKIAESCGIKIGNINIDEEFDQFWNKVYFGNYIEEICGIGDSRAKDFAKQNRDSYNDNLFRFVNENSIDVIFVFGRLIYNNMPSCSKDEAVNIVATEQLWVGKKRDRIDSVKYEPNIEHSHTKTLLLKELKVYGMRHPSAKSGYCVENYQQYLAQVFNSCISQNSAGIDAFNNGRGSFYNNI